MHDCLDQITTEFKKHSDCVQQPGQCKLKSDTFVIHSGGKGCAD